MAYCLNYQSISVQCITTWPLGRTMTISHCKFLSAKIKVQSNRILCLQNKFYVGVYVHVRQEKVEIISTKLLMMVTSITELDVIYLSLSLPEYI